MVQKSKENGRFLAALKGNKREICMKSENMERRIGLGGKDRK